MAYDGIITYAMARELSERLTQGKIEKVYQPGAELLLLQIHTRAGNVRLLASCGSQSARLCLTEERYQNPEQPPSFCMLLRKHLQGGRITALRQRDSERLIEIDIEAQTELGFHCSRRLIVEIMGKHSNIVLVDLETGKIIDAIKRISIDVNRYRQLLPGLPYVYPPAQDKTPFKEAGAADFPAESGGERSEALLMKHIAGISPAIARELLLAEDPPGRLQGILQAVREGTACPRIYLDAEGNPREFHITELREYAGLRVRTFDTLSACVEFYYQHREASNTVRQKSQPLAKIVRAAIEKAERKRQRLGEDLLRAEHADHYRLYGELLNAHLHEVTPGAREVTVSNYYDGQPVTIPLSERLSPARNAQQYFKKYGKAKTAIHEKTAQLEETDADLRYLEQVLLSIESADSERALDEIKEELVETGYVRYRPRRGLRHKPARPEPLAYRLSDGHRVLVGRNNKENDRLTLRTARKSDVWLHTKDIPGSHVILQLVEGEVLADLPADTLYAAAAVAAYHSKARASANVPVDYVPVRYVKKPGGAKPGMVIFTHNATVYVDPVLPEDAGGEG